MGIPSISEIIIWGIAIPIYGSIGYAFYLAVKALKKYVNKKN